MTTQYGSPLTGEQMKMLRLAGLPDEPVRDCDGSLISAGNRSFNKRHAPYSLPADHIAYTLLEAGWLDGRNVRLWFGGEKAPDDWDGGDIMRRDGFTGGGVDWKHDGDGCDIIAYIAKAEARRSPDTPSDPTIGRGLSDFEQLKLALYLLRNIVAATEQPPVAREVFLNYYIARANFELGAEGKLK